MRITWAGERGRDAKEETYNRLRPHSSLGYMPAAPHAILAADTIPVLVGLT
jgi:transposase InsO family protein